MREKTVSWNEFFFKRVLGTKNTEFTRFGFQFLNYVWRNGIGAREGTREVNGFKTYSERISNSNSNSQEQNFEQRNRDSQDDRKSKRKVAELNRIQVEQRTSYRNRTTDPKVQNLGNEVPNQWIIYNIALMRSWLSWITKWMMWCEIYHVGFSKHDPIWRPFLPCWNVCYRSHPPKEMLHSLISWFPNIFVPYSFGGPATSPFPRWSVSTGR